MNDIFSQEEYEKMLCWEEAYLKELLSFTFQYENMIMWPYVRVHLYSDVMSFYDSKIAMGLDSSKNESVGEIRHILNEIKKLVFELSDSSKYKKCDILFIVKDKNGYSHSEEGWRNRTCDLFASIYENRTIMLEEEWGKQKRVFERSINYNRLYLKGHFNRFRILKNKDEHTIDSFLDFIVKTFPLSIPMNSIENIRNELIYYAKSNQFIMAFFKKIFVKCNPRVVFLTDGFYGGIKAPLIYCAKKKNIMVFELQHGEVGKNHEAYNFPEVYKFREDYLEYVPSVFLTLGNYWNDKVRLPIEVRELGSANFFLGKSKVLMKSSRTGVGIAIILQNEVKGMLELIKFLDKHLDEKYYFIVKGRLNQKGRVDEFKDIVGNEERIVTMVEEDIYDCIGMADYVISNYSTVLYEAIACKKKVIVYNYCNVSAGRFPSDLGEWADNPDEVMDLLKKDSGWENFENVCCFFSENPIKNYTELLKDYIQLD